MRVFKAEKKGHRDGDKRNERANNESFTDQELTLVNMFREVKLSERKYVIDLLKSMTSRI